VRASGMERPPTLITKRLINEISQGANQEPARSHSEAREKGVVGEL
jgi:hypothetical protein